VQALSSVILALRDKGYTIVLVEQNFRFALSLADRFYVMEHGRIVDGFAASELQGKLGGLKVRLGI
jgi:branched-chain amino acid transport system ATP-binding protein